MPTNCVPKEMLECIIAHSQGKTIQYKSKVVSPGNWLDTIGDPVWELGCEYRVKPEEPTIITVYGSHPKLVKVEEMQNNYTWCFLHNNFNKVKMLTDTMEIDIEEKTGKIVAVRLINT